MRVASHTLGAPARRWRAG